ncbi:copper chaperone PCu(A)C [Neptunicella marina]|uniref:Copper chaperone PCu(A)C n=1 Tax=Neptunicella marina TaxID=2125989 RepID=A0A8J6IVP7_9ALTE|nr:copper chaperone PCu(A)C [Neptunicella marina]MBC3767536.1 copper chaperone PCu(A)C [Neptunicella marina]
MRYLLLMLIGLFSTTAAATIEISDATVRLLPPGVKNTSAYFTINNSDKTDCIIVAAQTDIAARTELHAHMMHNNMMHMMKQESVTLKAGEQLQFQPGGLHLMLFDLKQPLKEDQQVMLTLIMQDGQKIEFSAVVKRPGAQKMSQHQHH